MTSTPNQRDTRSPDFVVFSDDWGEHPSSCQHIFRHIAQDHRVLWVNTIGMRNPTFTLTDLRKIAKKCRKMLRIRRQHGERAEPVGHLSVCQPIMLPFSELSLVRRFNRWSVSRRIRSAASALNFRDPIIVSTVPNAAEYPEVLAGRRIIYYCVDDFSLWPGVDSTRVSDMERRMVEQSSAIIAASGTLAEKFTEFGRHVAVLTHGVDLDHFRTRATSEHPILKRIPEPRVGFFGLIDGRFDRNLIQALAAQMPDTNFVFAGPVDSTAGELPVRENLHFIGALAYTELPAFIVGIRALILPYKVDELGRMLSPLKLKEYLATCKPVVSSPISAVYDWESFLLVAHAPNEWVEALRGIIEQKSVESVSKVHAQLAIESWKSKAESFLVICRNVKHGNSQYSDGEGDLAERNRGPDSVEELARENEH